MKQRISQIIRFLVFLFIALFLLYLAFRGIDVGMVWEDLRHARYAWLLITIPAGILSHIFRAWRWNLLIEPLGYNPPLTNTFFAVMSGYLANLALPRLGEVVRCGSLTKTDKVPFDTLIGTVIIERIVDMISLLVLLVITFLIKVSFFGSFFITRVFRPLGDRLSSLAGHPVRILAVVTVAVVLLLLIWLFRKKLKNIPLVRKIFDFFRGIAEGIGTIRNLHNKPLFLLFTLLIWLMYFLSAWLVLYMLPETSSLTAVDGLFLLVVGSLGMVIPVQGGIGAYHWIVSMALTLYGISRETGLAVATLAHESQTLLILAVGGFSMIMVATRKNKKVSLSPKEATDGQV